MLSIFASLVNNYFQETFKVRSYVCTIKHMNSTIAEYGYIVPQDIGGQKLGKTDSKSCSRASPSGHYVVAYLEIDTAGSGGV